MKGGDYLREVSNRGTAIIRGNTVKASLDFSIKLLYAGPFFPTEKGSRFVFLDEDSISISRVFISRFSFFAGGSFRKAL